MGQVNGTVAAMSDKYDKFSVCVDDVWYSSKFAISCATGDVVTFDNGDKKWCRGLKVVSSGGGSPPAAKATGGAGAAPYVAKASFPIPVDTKDRSIVRQNSLTHATKLYTSRFSGGESIDAADAERIIELARIFEDYSCGDSDAREAQEMLKDM